MTGPAGVEGNRRGAAVLDRRSGLAAERLLSERFGAFEPDLRRLQETESPYRIKNVADVTDLIKGFSAKDREVATTMQKIKSAAVLEIGAQTEGQAVADDLNGHHDRTVLLLEDTDGNRASVSLALFGTAPGVDVPSGETFEPTLHGGNFGGMGIYERKPEEMDQDPLLHALHHADELSNTMKSKAESIGVGQRLAGSKAIITEFTGRGTWIGTEGKQTPAQKAMQIATGMIFSKAGPEPFNRIITGSDARQTDESIDNMGLGSRLAGGETSYNIVGTRDEGLYPTHGFVKYSIIGSYEALREHSDGDLPALPDAKVIIQGVGKIGTAALEGYLEAGTKNIVIADKLLDLDPDSIDTDTKAAQDKLRATLSELNMAYPDAHIGVVSTDVIWDQAADVISPCSTDEHIIDEAIVDRMERSGIKAVIAGANNMLKNLEIGKYAENKNVIMLPEVMTNNGSATAAATEPILRHEIDAGRQPDRKTGIQNVLVPAIKEAAGRNVERLVREYLATPPADRTSLYQKGLEIFI